ncbi:MFS transporter [Marivirga lumbricoides]|uniref:MFS transporter n=1 Tax=Marivirga lumbricoides TaxID=1046115 RepID=A0A2T4DSX6_9BACT|nr:MFS transporter [Marivirga lumbricoides]GGC45161.1 MFS transporter [Marivirga lumbricoides]
MTSQSQSSLTKSRIAISIIFLCYGLTFASWASRIPTITEKFNLDETSLGALLLMLPLGSFISLPLAGFLVAKWNSKTVTKLSINLYLLSLFTIGFVENIYILGFVLFCLGLMGNMLNIAINTQAVGLEIYFKRNIMATFHGMWSLAGFAGAAIGAFMIGADVLIKYHYAIIFGSGIVAAWFSFNWLLKNDQEEGGDKPLFALPDKHLVLLGIIAFCSMLAEGTMFDWSGVYFKKIVNAPEKWVGLGYTAFMISMAGTRFLADNFTKKYGIKRVIRVSGMFTVTGLLLSILAPYFVTALLGFFIVGIGVSSVVPLVFSAAGRTKTMSSGVALASVSTMAFFGFLIGPPLIGFLAGWMNLQLSFAFIVLTGVATVILAGKIKVE